MQLSATEREHIPAGIRIHMIKAARGSYIRTPDGKFFAIRQTPSISTTGTPVPPPPPTVPPSLSFNPIDQFLSSKNFATNPKKELYFLLS